MSSRIEFSKRVKEMCHQHIHKQITSSLKYATSSTQWHSKFKIVEDADDTTWLFKTKGSVHHIRCLSRFDGTIEQVMEVLCTNTPEAERMVLGRKECVRSELLCTIVPYSNRRPYHNVGIKRQVIAPAWKGSRARDFLFVEVTDLATDKNGLRHGYKVIDSIRVPQMEGDSSDACIRGSLRTTSYIVRETSNENEVELIFATQIEMKGNERLSDQSSSYLAQQFAQRVRNIREALVEVTI